MTPQELLAKLNQFTDGLASIASHIESLELAYRIFNNFRALNEEAQDIAIQIKMHKDFIWFFYHEAELTSSLSSENKRFFENHFQSIDNDFNTIFNEEEAAFQTNPQLWQEVCEWKKRSYQHATKQKDMYLQYGLGAGLGFLLVATIVMKEYVVEPKESTESGSEEKPQVTTMDYVYWLLIHTFTLAYNQYCEKNINQDFNRLTQYFRKKFGLIPPALDLNNPPVSSRYFFTAVNYTTQLGLLTIRFTDNPSVTHRILMTIAPELAYLLARVESSCTAPILNRLFSLYNGCRRTDPPQEQTPLLNPEPSPSYVQRLFNYFC